jgi:hypothetical protein
MADYKLLQNTDTVKRTSDHTTIPNDPGNVDWIEYQEWLAAGGVPDPYFTPQIDPELDSVGTGKTAAEILEVT